MAQSAREKTIDVLLVEDNPGDVRLIEEAFNAGSLRVDLHTFTYGEDALKYLHRQGDYEDVARPDIVLLDLNLPEMSGFTVLEEIKRTPDLQSIPVIILTSSQTDEDIVKGYRKHANAYLTKPVNVDEFVDLARAFDDFWIQKVELPPSDP